MLNYLERLHRPMRAAGMVQRASPRPLRFESLDPRLMLDASGDTIVTFNVTIAGQQHQFQVELFNTAAPQTVKNFLNYVDSGAYDNSFFHRIVNQLASQTSDAFQIVQGGGYSADGLPYSLIPPITGTTHVDTSQQAVLPNEYSATNPNVIGTIAMALTSDSSGTPQASSGTSEWFFNLSDNATTLSPAQQKGVGYAVFGKIVGDDYSTLTQILQAKTLAQLASQDYVDNVFNKLSPDDQKKVATFVDTPLINIVDPDPHSITAANLAIINSITHPSVTGTLFADVDSDGSQDSGEVPLSGWTVYVDANNDGVFQNSEASALTDSTGKYTITNLAAGTYTVRVAPQANWSQTSPAANAAYTVTLAQGELITGKDFGEKLSIAAPLQPALSPGFDSPAGAPLDNVTNLTTLHFDVAGVLPGMTVNLYSYTAQNVGTLIGTAVASGTTVAITTTSPLGEGEHLIRAQATMAGFSSAFSPTQGVLVDTTAPTITTANAPDGAVGTVYSLVIATNDSGAEKFTIISGPAGMQINSTTGAISWTPTAGQVGVQQFVVGVTDVAGNLSQKSFSAAIDGPPTFAQIGSQVVNQGATLTITPTVGAIHLPLVFSLADGAPAGMTIDPQTGIVTWKPTAADPAGQYKITIKVTDAVQQTAASEQIAILVNAPPVLAPIADQTIDELQSFTLPITATDENQVDFSFATGAPDGAQVSWTSIAPGAGIFSTNTGKFVWTPSESQGPGTYTIVVKATDPGGLSTTKSFQVTVNEADSPPVFQPVVAGTVVQGATLTLQVAAVDSDLPAQQLTYSLADDAPAGAQIDPQTGLITWNVPNDYATGLLQFTARVTSDGASAQSVTQVVSVNVLSAGSPGTPTTPPGGGLTGFDLFTTGAVSLGPYALGLAIDTGVSINGGLSLVPFGAALPGALPAQVAALQQLAGIPLAGPTLDLTAAGHLAAGIIDFVIGFDAGVPHDDEGMEVELARGGGGQGYRTPEEQGDVQRTGALEALDEDSSSDAGTNQQNTIKVPRAPVPQPTDGSQSRLFWGPPQARMGMMKSQQAGRHIVAVRGGTMVLPLLPRSNATSARERTAANGSASRNHQQAAAALAMPLLIAQLPESRLTTTRDRLKKWLAPQQ